MKSNQTPKKLSIIIPVFNEEKTIETVLKKVVKLKLPKYFQKEVIVVDDHSTDDTGKILKKINARHLKIIRHKENMGKGAAVRSGFKVSTGHLLIIQDADLEYDPKYIKDLLAAHNNHTNLAVYGTRLKNYPLKIWGEHKTVLPLHWFGNKFLTSLTNMLFLTNLTDMETCYKLIPKEAIDKIVLNSNKFEIEVELTTKLLKLGYKIQEVPIKVVPRTHQEGKKISWRDGFAAVYALIKYRFTD